MQDFQASIILVFGGLMAGFINTIAGSGSLITLPLLMIFGGLNTQIANGTNRLGILFQTFIGWRQLRVKEGLSIKGNIKLLVPTVIGSIMGVLVALEVKKEIFQNILLVIMAVMLFVILSNSKSWLKSKTKVKEFPLTYLIIIFLLIGIYGGFIQAGIGVILLSVFVILLGYSLNAANALKNLIIFCYTIPVFIIFIINDKVNWPAALLLTIGQIVGAYLGSLFAVKYKHSKVIIRYLLILVILFAMIRLLVFNLDT